MKIAATILAVILLVGCAVLTANSKQSQQPSDMKKDCAEIRRQYKLDDVIDNRQENPKTIYYNTYWNARCEGYSDSEARMLADGAYEYSINTVERVNG